MSKENVDTVRRGYELYAANDLEGVSALFADDAELADTGGLGLADTAAGTRPSKLPGNPSDTKVISITRRDRRFAPPAAYLGESSARP
jgi:ketosteroid isomerase-like protein